MEMFANSLERGKVPEELLYHRFNYYATCNFDNLGSAYVTLFALLVVNNWFIIMDAVAATTSEWSRLYFIFFYAIAVMVTVNVSTAFILEAFLIEANKDSEKADQNRRKRDSIGDTVLDRVRASFIARGLEIEIKLPQKMSRILMEMFNDGQQDREDPVVDYRT